MRGSLGPQLVIGCLSGLNSPFMSVGYKDGGSSYNPLLDFIVLLLVHDYQVVGIQLDGVRYLNGLNLQLVVKLLKWSE